MEVWKDIEGWEGFYQVSDKGRIRGLDRFNTVTRKGSTFKTFIAGCILKNSIDRGGYRVVSLEVASKKLKKQCKVHRLVALAFVPNPENKPEVNHKNGVKTDCRPVNLEWTTSKENMEHASKTGLLKTSKGEKHYRSKLSEETVFKIKYGKFDGMSHPQIARLFGIKRLQVLKIRNGINWKHV